MTKNLLFSTRFKQFVASVLLLTSGLANAQAPTITSFTPTSGAVGTAVTISGTGFNASLSSNVVLVGKTKATIQTANSTTITFLIPAGTPASSNISIINTGSKKQFVFSQKLAITKTLPNRTVNSTGFSPAINLNHANTNYGFGATGYVVNRESIKYADLNGDGKADLLVGAEDGQLHIYINSNSTPGQITASNFAKTSITVGNGSISSVVVDDFNNDGKVDFAVQDSNEKTYVYSNSSSGTTFSYNSTPLIINSGGYGLSSGDMNGDGLVDLVTHSGFFGDVKIFENTTNTSTIAFSSSASHTLNKSIQSRTYPKVGDLNGDGKADIVFAGDASPFVDILMNTTTSSYSFNDLSVSTYSDRSRAIFLDDIDRDGKIDVIASHSNGKLSVYKNTSGQIAASSYVNSSFTRTDFSGNENDSSYTVSDDLNGDGYPDVITSGRVWQNSGDGVISASTFALNYTNIYDTSYPTYPILIDLDSDGKSDIVSGSSTGGGIDIYRNKIGELPTITKTATLTNFTSCIGTASTAQTFTVSGSNLTANINIDTVASYEYSLDGSAYYTTLSLAPTSGTVSSTTVYVRLTNSSTGSPSGTISISSTNATTQTISITGTVNALTTISSQPPTSVSLCQNANYTLAANTSNATSYQWYSSATNSNTGGTSLGNTRNAQTSALTPSTTSPGTYYYYLVATGTCGTATSNLSTIVISPLSVAGTATGNATICFGTTTDLSLSGHNGTIQWKQSSTSNGTYTNVTGGTGATTASYTTAALTATTYFKAFVTSGGCTTVESNVITVTVTAGPRLFNQALNFDGTNDKVTVSSTSALNVTNFTLEAWVKIDPTTNNRMGIVGKPSWVSGGNSSSGMGYGLDIEYGSIRVFGGQNDSTWGGTGVALSTAGDSGTSITGNWAHVAGTYDGVNFKLYINGVLKNTGAYNGTIWNNTVPLTIGSWPGEPKFFRGNIDEVRVWNVARSAAEISQSKDIELNGNETGLVAYYNLNQGTPGGSNSTVTTAINKTSNALTGTLDSMALTGATSNWIASGPMILSEPTVCLNTTTTITHTNSGGTWSSSNGAVLSINASTGEATANATGTATISYAYTLNGCTYTSTKLFTVNALPTAPVASSPVNLCQGATATALIATATSGNTLQWYTVASAGTASSTAPSPTTSILASTDYYVSQKNTTTTCESPRTTITVTVNALPTISGVQPISVGGTPLQLTGSGTAASSNAWVSATPTIASVSANGLVTPLRSGSTIITFTNASGCSATTTITVKDCATPFSNALRFDGLNDRVVVDNVGNNANLTFTGTTSFSIEAWVKRENTNGIAMIFSKYHSGVGANYWFGISGTGKPTFSREVVPYNVESPDVLPVNEWHHLAATYDGSQMKIYVDGVLKNTISSPNSVPNYVSNVKVHIGTGLNQANAPIFTYKGDLDEIRVWNVARTATQIQQTYNTILQGNETGLVAYYDFNHGIAGGNNASINTVVNAVNSASNGALTDFEKNGITSNFVASTIANLDISGAATICSNSSSQYSHPIAGGTWSISTSGANATISASGLVTSTVNENITLSYTYTLNGCPFTATKAISVNTPLAPVATSTVNLCQGGSATALTATALTGHTLQWYTVATAGTANTSAPTPSRSASGSTLYYVSQKNNASTCEGPRTTITVTVNPATAITTQPVSPTAVCINASSNTISVTATGQNLTYQWYTNTANSTTGATAIANATTNSYEMPTNVVGTKYYYVVVTGTCGSPITSSIVSQVINSSTFTTDVSGAAQNLAYGGTATALTVASPGATAYQWYSTPSNPSLLSGFSGTTGFTSSTGAFQAYSASGGASPAINAGVLTFAYIDGSSVYRDFNLDQTATTISFSTEYAETDRNNDRAGDTGKIQLQFLNAGNVPVGTIVESAVFTGTLTFQTVALSNVSIPAGATKARVTFLQVNETENWAGNYGIAFRNPSVTTNVALNGTAINGATAASYTPLTTTPGTLYYYVVASGGCTTVTSSLSGLITVGKQNPTIASMAAISKTVGDAAFTLTAPTSNGTGAFTFTSSNAAVATISGTTVTVVGAGTATITATQATDANYNAGSVTTTLTVAKGNPTIAAMADLSKTVGDAAFTLTSPTSNSTGAFTYTSSNTAVATISGSMLTVVGAGTATITATQASSTNYNAGSVTATITVAKRNPTIASMATISKTFGDAAFTLTAPTSNSTGAFTYTSSNTAVATISGTTVTVVGAGTATVTATQAANTNYNSGSVTVSLTVAKAARTLTTFPNINKTTTDVPFTLVAPTTNTGTGAITYSSSNLAVATINGATVTIVGIGTSVITATQAADANYEATSINATLTVIIGDSDGDGVSDAQEAIDGTNPNASDSFKDTDNDGVADSVETENGTDPNDSASFIDTDNDGVPNYVEARQGTSPTTPGDAIDSDRDGVPDYVEVQQGTNPIVPGAKDTDGDGVPDYIEVQQGTSPTTPGNVLIDSDADGVPDYIEVQQGTSPTNPSDAIDSDGDGVPNYVEVQQGTNPTTPGARDTDGDGVPDFIEKQQGTNPTNPGARDTDGDGVPDYIEVQQGTSPTTSGARDTDGDGVPDYVEVQQGTNPTIPGAKDTDGDGVPDYVEVQQGTSPSIPGAKDTDGDGVPDYIEVQQGTSPTTPGNVVIDTDGDGVPDYIEVQQGTSPTTSGARDTDGDGVPDYVEIQQGTNPSTPGAKDTDGDGVPDYVEVQQGTNPTTPGAKDTDGDGVPDYVEVQQGTNPANPGDTIIDTDEDGVPDYVEVQQGTSPTTPGAKDTDGDGVPDYVEIQQGTDPKTPGARDSDGDGVPDYIEVQQGTSPTTPGDVLIDTDADGVPDYVEVQQGTSPTTPGDAIDTDDDGVPDYIEVQQGTSPTTPGAKDTDGDGVPDYIEVQQGTNPTTPGAKDTDGDGVPDYIEVQQGTNPATPGDAIIDTDEDGVPDYVEVQQGTDPAVPGARDTDGDGVPDYIEVQQGTNPTIPGDADDTDGDGVPDYVEVQQGTNPTTPGAKDTDGDGVPDYIEVQQGTNPNTPGNVVIDTDGDGVPNYIEVQQGTNPTTPGARDTDGDGVPDYVEVQQGTNPTTPGARDTDGDGVPDYVEVQQGTNPTTPGDVLADTDADGVPDYIEVQQGTNPAVPGDAIDTDGDGVPNYVEVQQGTNPAVPGDAIDTDRDGVPDYIEVQQGTSPTTPGAKDTDGDGVPDYVEAQQGTNPSTPGDAIVDTDRDGVPDYIEVQQGTSPTTPGAKDTDGDGVPDYIEVQQGTNPTTPGAKDTDGDGVPDYIEVQQGTNPSTPGAKDTDGDGVPDYIEVQQGTNPTTTGDKLLDIDGDGVPNYVEVQQGTNPRMPGAKDTDRDGVPDYVEVQQGTNPTTPGAKDTDGDGVPDYVEVQQGTSPTIPGARDTDGDGVPDYIEIQLGNNPAVADAPDADSDGISNYKEGYNFRTPGASRDTDRDGTPDYLDLDSDGDSVLDRNDAFPINPLEWTDSDDDGTGDNADTDDDNDGILDGCDVDVNGDGIPDNGTDLDADGINDGCDADKDGDGVNNTSDNCPSSPNTNQADRDRDGLGDVCDTVELDVMQALTPNGDGINDTWVIYNLGNHPGTIVRVFNSNGTQVFYSANYQNNWTGNYEGKNEMLPVGSYMFQIDLGGDGSIDSQGWMYISK